MEKILYPEEKQVQWREQVLRKFQVEQEHPTKIYLATPYTHERLAVMDMRAIIASFLAAYFTEAGFCVYSPILVGHTMLKYIELPHNYEFWETRDKQFIQWCNEFWMVKLDDWGESTGMARELTYARILGKTLKTVDILTGMNERDFSRECIFLKTRGKFSEKVNLNISVKELV